MIWELTTIANNIVSSLADFNPIGPDGYFSCLDDLIASMTCPSFEHGPDESV